MKDIGLYSRTLKHFFSISYNIFHKSLKLYISHSGIVPIRPYTSYVWCTIEYMGQTFQSIFNIKKISVYWVVAHTQARSSETKNSLPITGIKTEESPYIKIDIPKERNIENEQAATP